MASATLQSAIDNVDAQILALTTNPIKPNYSLDGESYSWSELLAMLTEKRLTLEMALQRSDGPFEVRSRGIT